MTMPRTLLLLTLILPATLHAQTRSSSAYVVTQNGREIGKERLTLESPGAGLANRRMKVEATRLAGGQSEAVLSRDAEGRFDALQMEFTDSAGTELIRAGIRGNRIIITSSGPAGRRTRELPVADNIVPLDESMQSLLYLAARRATPPGRALTGLYLRTGRQAAFTATRRDMGSRGSAVDFTGDVTGQMLLDTAGEMLRLDVHTSGISLNQLPR
jgi:hypothetical protein